MTRRGFMLATAIATPSHLQIPINRVIDSRAKCTPDQLHHFWQSVWPEAVRDFAGGRMSLVTLDTPGEVKRSPGDKPIFVGLRRGVINLVLTDHIPMKWDSGRASAGVTTIYEGYHICLIAMSYAHGNQAPYLSTNTCVHELLHALMQDVFIAHPKWYQSGGREFRIDWYATRLWLFHDGSAIREAAQAYLTRLRAKA